MSFNILQKTDATVDELAAAYVAIEIQKFELEEQKQAAYDEMVDCQQSAMAGDGKAPAKLKKAKETFQDLQLQVDAATDALEKIRSRIEIELPGHLQQQIDALQNARGKLVTRQEKLKAEYLDACARAACLNEQLKGRRFLHLNNGEMTEGTPGVDFDFTRLDHADSKTFLQAVEQHRSGYDGNLKSELRDIDTRREKLEKRLTEGGFAQQADKLIESKRPKAPEPEPEQVRGRPTTTGRVIDYDHLAVQY